ncbi:gamma-glutamylcyclotransferase family protein [Desulfobulbus alkaliphilus]|uniref:gamma-glutamylcyclotransferase family protein n=1 Tax=Desulfobulbus alkaliphilus TaxID=869814 RepID=UPI001F065B21|nr:gamma-glutamylcyclotransferase family protein [Desulfobulbus alkaliphilus]
MTEHAMNPDEPLKENTQGMLRLFVYGTLKRGFWNHDRFCASAKKIEPAMAWGRLYHLSAGYPALVVPESIILAHGTKDPLLDTQIQANIRFQICSRPDGDWDLVHGELVTFTDPLNDLPPIDRLEGFRPGGHSMYQRVLVAIVTQDHINVMPVWIYIMECRTQCKRISEGRRERI